MTESRLEPENLVVLDRRGQLDSEQTLVLDRLYRQDARVGELYHWGRAFDEEDRVQPGDESIVARSTDRALRRYAALKKRQADGARRQVEPRLARWFIAAILVGSSATAAVVGVLTYRAPEHRADAAASAAASRVRSPTIARTEKALEPPVEPAKPAASPKDPRQGSALAEASKGNPASMTTTAAPVASLGQGPASRVNRIWPATQAAALDASSLSAIDEASDSHAAAMASNAPLPSEAAALPSETAAELFNAANLARRQGKTAVCVIRYRELQRRFPGSEEARQSYVSLGKVLRANGDVAGAVREFTSYLRYPGALEAEALVGRAEGLSALGQTAQERATWQRLLDRFPASVYASRARQRLNELK